MAASAILRLPSVRRYLFRTASQHEVRGRRPRVRPTAPSLQALQTRSDM